MPHTWLGPFSDHDLPSNRITEMIESSKETENLLVSISKETGTFGSENFVG